MKHILSIFVIVTCFASKDVLAKTASVNKAFQAPKLILITIDGLRTQEVFNGIDERLYQHEKYVSKKAQLANTYWHEDAKKRQQKLLPFIATTIVNDGVLLGNSLEGERITVANNMNFSYPGYHEIFTGKLDASITSNAKIVAKYPSFLEVLADKYPKEFKPAAFASWDVFPYILRRGLHDVYINAGFEPYEVADANTAIPLVERNRLSLLNRLQVDTPSPWATVRLDAFTHAYAMHHLKSHKPRVMSISYGDTDDFAHDGKYDEYILASTRTDRFIKEVWDYLQSDTFYANKTNLIITTDHGRGVSPDDWQHHASVVAVKGYMKALGHFEHGIVGSENVWIAAIGPNIRKPLSSEFSASTIQITPTIYSLLDKCELAAKQDYKAIDIIKENPCE